MPDFISLPFIETTKNLEVPETFTYRLGSKCSSCEQPVSYTDSMCPCNCRTFCHQACFIKNLNELNSQKD